MKAMVLFGTRPEIIKLAPVIKELERFEPDVKSVLVSTGQHLEFTQQMLGLFDIRADYELNVMKNRQTLAHVVSSVVRDVDDIIVHEQPDVLIVQGDTASCAAGAIAANMRAVRVAHVEAGLRTPDKFVPFPEEINRRILGVCADWHFAPTARAQDNLLREGKRPGSVYVTGNTVVDAMHAILESQPVTEYRAEKSGLRDVLVTMHRRENLGDGLRRICGAIRSLVDDHPDVRVLIPVHHNPAVGDVVHDELDGHERVQLLPPLSYVDFLHILRGCYFVMTDSGGVQEEAPSLGKPILVLRDVSERQEAVDAGVAVLVGTDERKIYAAAHELLTDETTYARMAKETCVFGDGFASERIVSVLVRDFRREEPARRSAQKPVREARAPALV